MFYSSTDYNTVSSQRGLKVSWIIQNIKAEHHDAWLTFYTLVGRQAVHPSEAMRRLLLSWFPSYLLFPSGWV